ncbi:hypothetical protein [Aestuariimicrobium sp. T2.26MG-19.2B]|uniref:hypothetical protein n=1 Tax=Aestuariimicrobium sp. T2.26MG-19.2B TaxID=3040679 RepID=UPI00254175B1|nr:hypothetical protein [Aestuariimicrobium sp. T2.26MG-19.2B]
MTRFMDRSGGWPPYANGRTVGECLGVVLDETWWHHRFCVRDLDLITASSDREGAGG